MYKATVWYVLPFVCTTRHDGKKVHVTTKLPLVGRSTTVVHNDAYTYMNSLKSPCRFRFRLLCFHLAHSAFMLNRAAEFKLKTYRSVNS